VIGNWNITSFTGKEHELVDEAKQYSPDVVGISSTKCCDCSTVELDHGWKLISNDEPAQFAQAGVSILVSPQLANCLDDWIPLGGCAC